MKALEEFLDKIDNDLAWRRVEVSNLLLIRKKNDDRVILKSVILLLYSHWEGFVKTVCREYLIHIHNQKISLVKLHSNFRLIQLKGIIKQMKDSCERPSLANEISFLQRFESPHKIFKLEKNFIQNPRDKTVINTKDNLSFQEFMFLLDIIGIVWSDEVYTKKIYMDVRLLDLRNRIAHGNKLDFISGDIDLNLESVVELRDVVFTFLTFLAEDLKIYAEEEFYLVRNSEKQKDYCDRRNALLMPTLKSIVN